jgi:hypothetical protein
MSSDESIPDTSFAQVGFDPVLTEDSALAYLQRDDIASEVLERIGKSGPVMKSRRVKLALAAHCKTPRHVALPLLRHLFTFDLMQVALTPTTPPDIKKAAEESLVSRLETISSGEKLTLARQASGRMAGELLLDPEPRVLKAALENSRLTEAAVVKALLGGSAKTEFVQMVCHHPKWSLRRDVRVAMLRNENTPLARALEFSRGVPASLLKDILQVSKLPENVKAALRNQGVLER